MNATSRIFALTLSSALLTSAPAATQGIDLATIVAQFYPQSLDAELVQIDAADTAVHNQCYAVLASDSQGNPTLVIAAYANSYSGAVRVLQRSGASFAVVYEPTDDLLIGRTCKAEALDLDGDGAPEAIIKFGVRAATLDWVYAWRNGTLVNISPTSQVPQAAQADTQLFDTEVVDLNGDGVMELYSFSPRSVDPSDPVPADKVFRLSAGTYVLDKPVVSLWTLQRTTGGPQTVTAPIRPPAGAVCPFTLRVLNGTGTVGAGQRVENAVESGRIWFNGEEIVRPSDFGNQVSTIVRTVALQASNELTVRLGGSPGGRITIVIEPASWTP